MNMNKKLAGGLVGLTALLMSSVINAVTVQMSPSTQAVTVGDPLSISVGGVDFQNGLGAGTTSIIWDPAQLTLNTSEADILADLIALGASNSGFSTTVDLNAAAGTLDAVFEDAFGDSITPATSFTLFTLDFVANPPPSTSILDIGFVANAGDWFDFNNVKILNSDVVYNGAEVIVQAVPVPAAVWLFGSGLIGLVGVARRKTQLA